jgi:hypothetical protein
MDRGVKRPDFISRSSKSLHASGVLIGDLHGARHDPRREPGGGECRGIARAAREDPRALRVEHHHRRLLGLERSELHLGTSSAENTHWKATAQVTWKWLENDPGNPNVARYVPETGSVTLTDLQPNCSVDGSPPQNPPLKPGAIWWLDLGIADERRWPDDRGRHKRRRGKLFLDLHRQFSPTAEKGDVSRVGPKNNSLVTVSNSLQNRSIQ